MSFCNVCRCLGTIILTNTDSTLAVESIGPEASKLNLALGHVGVLDEKPSTKDALGKNIQDGIGNDLTINTNFARSISKTPDTAARLARSKEDVSAILTWGRLSRARLCNQQWQQRSREAWGLCWQHWHHR